MAELVSPMDQLTTLYKSWNGVANSNSAYEIEQESFVSRPNVLADRIFLNRIPDVAPTDNLNPDATWSIVTTPDATRKPSVSLPWLVQYLNLPLTSFVGNPNETFYFGSAMTGSSVPPGTNLLINLLLPLMTSSVSIAQGYTVTVSTTSTGSNVIPPSNYTLDRSAGIITVMPGNGVSASSPPYISFWRYEGPTLRDAAIQSDANGNLTFSGNITMNQNLAVAGTFTSGSFTTTSLNVTGPVTLSSTLDVTGSTTLADLSTSSFTTGTLTGDTITATNYIGDSLNVTNNVVVGGGGVTTTGPIAAAAINSVGTIHSQGTLSADGTITANSSLNVTAGTLTVNNGIVSTTLDVSDSIITDTLVTSGQVTANGLIVANAGLTITGGTFSFPSQDLSIGGGLDVSGSTTLRGGLVVSGKTARSTVVTSSEIDLSGGTAYGRISKDISGNVLRLTASALPDVNARFLLSSYDGAAIMSIGDGAGNPTLVSMPGTLVAPTIGTGGKTTVVGGLDISGSSGTFLNVYGNGTAAPVRIIGGAAGGAGYISMNDTNISNSLTIGCNTDYWNNIALTPSTTTVTGTLVAPTIVGTGATVSISGTDGVTIGPASFYGGAFNGSVISANASIQPRIGLRSTYPDGSSNIVYWDGKSLLPGGEKPRADGYDLGIPSKYWDNIYTSNINPGRTTAININGGGTTTVNGTLVGTGAASFQSLTVNGATPVYTIPGNYNTGINVSGNGTGTLALSLADTPYHPVSFGTGTQSFTLGADGRLPGTYAFSNDETENLILNIYATTGVTYKGRYTICFANKNATAAQFTLYADGIYSGLQYNAMPRGAVISVDVIVGRWNKICYANWAYATQAPNTAV